MALWAVYWEGFAFGLQEFPGKGPKAILNGFNTLKMFPAKNRDRLLREWNRGTAKNYRIRRNLKAGSEMNLPFLSG